MDSKKKKFHWSKAKVKKCMNGAISVLLCLLLTPFLTATLALIEYARYQEIMEIADELMELTELFALADYDQYINNRFGLLAVSQENKLGDGLENVLVENAKITGNQLVPSNVSVSGKYALNNTNVLRQQLVDFSQFVSPTALAMEEFGLEKLLNQLKTLKSFDDVTSTVDSIADAVNAATTAAEKLDQLQKDLEKLKKSIEDVKTTARELGGKFSSLLNDERLDLSKLNSVSGIQELIQAFTDGGNSDGSLLDQIKDIYTGAYELKTKLDSVTSTIGSVKDDVVKVKDALKDAADAIKAINDTSDDNQGKSISSDMTKSVDDVIKDMEKLINNTLTDIKDDAIQNMQKAIDDSIKTVLNETGLSDVVSRYVEIANGSYFKLSDGKLSENAQKDIKDFLEMAKIIYKDAVSKDADDIPAYIVGYFSGRFVPNINVNFDKMISEIEGILKKAVFDTGDSATEKGTKLIKKLISLATSIFDLQFYSNLHLNANVTLQNPETDNGAQKFLDAKEKLFDSIDEFLSSIGGLNLIDMFKALGKMISAIGEMFAAIFERVKNIIDGIKGLGGGLGAIYNRLIISEYMVHSLPCRTDASLDDDGDVELTGRTLSGFSYGDIATGKGTFKGAELEYVYMGTDSETANQELTFWDVYFLRLLVSLPAIFTDGEVTSLAAAANAFAWVVYILYVLAEPFLDTVLLVNGGDAPLIKTKCWLTGTGLGEYVKRLSEHVTDCDDVKELLNNSVNDLKSDMKPSAGSDNKLDLDMSYKNHLLVMLMITVDTNKQVQRLSNLISLEATRYYADKDKTFSITKTYTTLDLSADMTFNPFVDLGLLAGDGPLNLTGHMTCTVSY